MLKNKKSKEKYMMPTLKFILKTVRENKPLLYFIYIAEIIVEVTITFVMLILPKMIIDELTGDMNTDKLILLTAVFVSIFIITYLSGNFLAYGKGILHEWFNEHFQLMLSEHAMKMDFEHTEDPAALDQLNKAKEGISWYSNGVAGILGPLKEIIKNAITFAGVVIIIASGSPWLLLIQLSSLAIISFLNQKVQKIELNSFKALSKLNRVFSYVFYQLADFRFGKDIRLYNSKEMMLEKSRVHNDEITDVWRKKSFKRLKYDEGMTGVNVIRDSLSYLYIGWQALRGIISIGEFTMLFSSTSTFFWSMNSIINNIQEIYRRSNYMYEFLRFLDYPAAMEKGAENVKGGEHVVEFSHVYFKYPRTEKYVLKDLSIKISSGEHLSIVGLNGAGKTTFIKLLCRLYNVTEGEILIDGKNIKCYSEEEYRKLFAVVFQDFKLFAFSLKENIALQNTADVSDDEIYNVLSQTGLEEDTKKLENGLDTVIYKSFDEKGTELSGGQKQKTAISRALFKNAPIVILDEPTAALDPVAEYEIYRHFNNLVGGRTAIYISHRLSSCKFCDRIAVFADDTIKEYGTHNELINLDGGIYAEMFKAQARYYA